MRVDELFEGWLSGNYAPLYHSTNLISAIAIVKENSLSSEHGAREARTSHYRDLENAHGFVSLTRSFSFANHWRTSDVIFVLDQNKLRRDFKLKPFDYFDWAKEAPEMPTGFKRSEAEEYTVKNIEPLDKYLIEILVKRSGIERIKNLILRHKIAVPKDPNKLHTGVNNKFVKKFTGLTDPKLATDPIWAPFTERNILLRNPKTKII